MIRLHDDPILERMCEEVELDADNLAPIANQIIDMRALLQASPTGVGLAAPQAGYANRIIIVRHTVMINPVINWSSPCKRTRKEGCLSYPNIQADVERSVRVKVTYFNESWTRFRGIKYDKFDACIVQHEIDHLNGICRVGDEWRRQEEFKQKWIDKAYEMGATSTPRVKE